MVHAQGACMDNLFPVDALLLMDLDMEPQNGRPVLAETEDYGAVVRNYTRGTSTVLLTADSHTGEYDDIVAGPDDPPVTCRGRVAWYMGERDDRSGRMSKSGVGSVREVTPGTWQVRVSRGYRRDGFRRTTYGTVRGTERDARVEAARLATAMGRDAYAGDPMTLAEWYLGVFLPSKEATCTRATVEFYRNA